MKKKKSETASKSADIKLNATSVEGGYIETDVQYSQTCKVKKVMDTSSSMPSRQSFGDESKKVNLKSKNKKDKNKGES